MHKKFKISNKKNHKNIIYKYKNIFYYMDYKIEKITLLTDNTFVLTLPKPKFKFKAGQCVWIMTDKLEYCIRKYAIYSGENDNKLEFLIREIPDGKLTPILKKLNVGDNIDIDTPDGKFIMEPDISKNKKIVFIASGTGIAPFRSMVRTHKKMNYQLIHGVRYKNESYNKEEYGDKYILCTSKDTEGDYHGRVTSYLNDKNFDKDTHFYLCGNSNMVNDVFNILKNKKFDNKQIHKEIYF